MNKFKVSYRLGGLFASIALVLFLCYAIGDASKEHSLLQDFARSIYREGCLAHLAGNTALGDAVASIVLGLLCLVITFCGCVVSWIVITILVGALVYGILLFLGLFDDKEQSKETGPPAPCPTGT